VGVWRATGAPLVGRPAKLITDASRAERAVCRIGPPADGAVEAGTAAPVRSAAAVAQLAASGQTVEPEGFDAAPSPVAREVPAAHVPGATSAFEAPGGGVGFRCAAEKLSAVVCANQSASTAVVPGTTPLEQCPAICDTSTLIARVLCVVARDSVAARLSVSATRFAASTLARYSCANALIAIATCLSAAAAGVALARSVAF
jgi:hypothetical protein